MPRLTPRTHQFPCINRERRHLLFNNAGRAYFILGAEDTKARRERVPPILTAELTEAIMGYGAELELVARRVGYIFRPWSNHRGWHQYARTRARCRLSEFLRGVCRSLALPEITPHGLRRTTSSAAEEAGATRESILSAIGWASQAVRDKHYVAPRVLRQRQMAAAQEVADARAFGKMVAG